MSDAYERRATTMALGARQREERAASLIARYDTDADFRSAVDDLVSATGLLLPETSLGKELDEIVLVARIKREELAAAAAAAVTEVG
jgi:hypothetical protein